MGIMGPVRYVVSTSIMTFSAPNYFLLWSGWRAASLLLPEWVYQYGDDHLYNLYQSMVVFFFEHATRLKVYVAGDVEVLRNRKEKVLYLSNHQSTVDWVCCNLLAIRQGSLGHLRYVMKNTLQKLPLYGFYFYQHGCIYVKRGGFSQVKMERALQHLAHRNVKSWMVMFPEGTRFIPEKVELIAKSQNLAQTAGLKPLYHHMTPRYKGTFLALNRLRDNLDAIYDVTIVYSGTLDANCNRRRAPHLIDFLWGKCPEVYLHLRRIPISHVPVDEEHFQRWIHDLFVTKDEMMKTIYEQAMTDQRLPIHTLGILDPLPMRRTFPSVCFFLMAFAPYWLYPKCAPLYWKTMVYGTLAGYSWLMLRSVC